MSEQKMRFALEQCVRLMENDLEGLALLQPELRLAREALAHQPVAAVTLTEDEIFDAFTDGAGIFNKTIPLSEQELKGFRAVIAAHIAKQNA